MRKKMVLLINPPNSNTIIDGQTMQFSNPSEHSDWSNYPATGVLSLASALRGIPNVQPVYIDGVVIPFSEILHFISDHKDDIALIGISALTASYEAGLKILTHARNQNPNIVHIIGNDHFTALPELCLTNRAELIDAGFVGNEVVTGLRRFVDKVVNGKINSFDNCPGIVFKSSNKIVSMPQQTERIFSDIDYDLLDAAFPHSSRYDASFQKVFPPRLKQWFGCEIHRGTAIEIARGCVKFRNDDACSFCSIQYGGMWKNNVNDGGAAWSIIRRAYEADYDYLYVTADELALTFRHLLLDMKKTIPLWLQRLPENERPIFTGYARADGIAVEKNAQLLFDLGFRVIMVGVDAGPKVSLQAINKQLLGPDATVRLDQLYEANRQAFIKAQNVGLKLRVGFVVGHIGMTKDLLEQNVKYFCDLVGEHPDVVCTADIEILSPEPGSKEYRYLLEPQLASQEARALGLWISDETIRRQIADKWCQRDIVDREEMVQDYVYALMPDLSLDDLVNARIKMRAFCRDEGILIGEG